VPPGKSTYVQVQIEQDQVAAPADINAELHVSVTIHTPEEVLWDNRSG